MNATGKLRIFMGYAAGVGKTFRMLDEAHAAVAAGADLVVGYFEPHGRKDTIARLTGLELIPRRHICYRGSDFDEMDTPAILVRCPRIALVDEFPHTNVPGAERAKRWEDVEALLASGIDVWTTMNVQHLESLNDQVFQISGVRVRETIPDWVVRQAAEIVMVDLTPRALIHRLERGAVYAPGKAEQAVRNFFKESTLASLRELALRETAHEAEQRAAPAHGAGRADRILAVVTSDPASAIAIRRARRFADFLEAACFAAAVEPASNPEAVARHLNFARNLHIETRSLEGADPADVILDFARINGITQIFVPRPISRSPWFRRDFVQRLTAAARHIEIVIVSGR
jgi:two-component system sensor histidine kinase KdpD